jgi:hypothetical protein
MEPKEECKLAGFGYFFGIGLGWESCEQRTEMIKIGFGGNYIRVLGLDLLSHNPFGLSYNRN